MVVPLFIFIMATFMVPIANMLIRSIDNQIVSDILPRSVEALKSWDETTGELPSEAVYKAMVEDLVEAKKARTNTKVGQRLNYEKPGMSSMFRSSARKVGKLKEGPYKEALIKIDKKWGDVANWQTIKLFSGAYTAGYFLAAQTPRTRSTTASNSSTATRPSTASCSSEPSCFRLSSRC